MLVKTLFGKERIIGLAGRRNTGKTNNLLFLLQDFRKQNSTVPVYVYGFSQDLDDWFKDHNIIRVNSIKQLSNKKDCLIVLDEFQKLKLNDRRYKDEVDSFKNFVYHNNVFAILSSPDIRCFNSVVGGLIERYVLKSVSINDCVNGSPLKKVVDGYKGEYKTLDLLDIPVNKLLVINDDRELVLECAYLEVVDTKQFNKNIFVKELSEKLSKQKRS